MLQDLDFAETFRPGSVAPVEAPTTLSREDAAARAHVYRLLSAAFVEEPDASYIEALRAPESLVALEEAGLHFDGDLVDADTASLLDALSIEFSTLFVASGGFPPIESARLTGRLQQEPYHQVRKFYASHGFELRRGKFHVFEDQLGVELMFAAELLERIVAALDSGDKASARRLERELKRFWTQHLGKWVRGYAGLIARAAEHSFYREMARFLAAFAQEEVVAMRLRIADADQGRLVVPKLDPKVEFNPDEPVCNGCAGAADPLADLRS